MMCVQWERHSFRATTTTHQAARLCVCAPVVCHSRPVGGTDGRNKKYRPKKPGPIFLPTPQFPKPPAFFLLSMFTTQLMEGLGANRVPSCASLEHHRRATETVQPAGERKSIQKTRFTLLTLMFSLFVCVSSHLATSRLPRCSSVTGPFAYSSKPLRILSCFSRVKKTSTDRQKKRVSFLSKSLSLCYKSTPTVHFLPPPSSWAATGPRNDPFLPSGMRIRTAGSPFLDG